MLVGIVAGELGVGEFAVSAGHATVILDFISKIVHVNCNLRHNCTTLEP
jgi:hypothetical protein